MEIKSKMGLKIVTLNSETFTFDHDYNRNAAGTATKLCAKDQ